MLARITVDIIQGTSDIIRMLLPPSWRSPREKALFVCLYLVRTKNIPYNSSKAISVNWLYSQVQYSLYFVCMQKKHTYQVSSHFWSELCSYKFYSQLATVCSQVHFLQAGRGSYIAIALCSQRAQEFGGISSQLHFLYIWYHIKF